MRLFVAVALPAEIKGNLREIQERARRLDRGGISWVKPENIHVTMKFLGEVEEGRVGSVSRAVEEVASSFSPFRVTIEGWGFFPSKKRPRVLWMGIETGKEELARINESAEKRLVLEGFKEEKRGFSPHLTFARIKNPAKVGPLVEGVGREERIEGGSFTVDSLVLFRSTLLPTGAVYDVVSEHPFGGVADE